MSGANSHPGAEGALPGLHWRTSGDPAELAEAGYRVISFADIRSDIIQPARQLARRVTLENPAQRLLDLLETTPKLAVTDVPTARNGDLRELYGFILEPAWRRDVDLVVVADRDLDELDADGLVEGDFGYPWTLERLIFLAERYQRRPFDGLPPLTPIELRLYEAMRSLGLSPRVQFGVGQFRLDFAFPDMQLAVEADGRQWHNPVRDRRRDSVLAAAGWRVLRFTGSAIHRDSTACARAVEQERRALATAIRYTPDPTETEPDGLIGGDGRPAGTRLSAWVRLVAWVRSALGTSSPSADAADTVPEAPFTLDAATEDDPPTAWLVDLDPSQRRAVLAGDGVVQVIAPAGSGKTTTLISRVQELLSRGVAANRILCCTFSKGAAKDLGRRLDEAGVAGVTTRSFSAVGWRILKEASLLRRDVGVISYGEWRWLANKAQRHVPDGVWIDPVDACELISRFKLVEMVSPEEAQALLAAKSEPSALERTSAALYELYEQKLAQKGWLDFDDLIAKSVELLRTTTAGRDRWQAMYECILVDEYQDIEPAQERLIQLLAAPHDALFCVGDEDQCIFAWRRASVERVIELDAVYPGLERHALGTNYRCPTKVVRLSRSLIEHNQRRFPKTILPKEGAQEGVVTLGLASSLDAQASHAARLVDSRERGEVAVLARSTRILREAALACARRGVKIDAPERVLARSGVNAVLLAYLRLFADLGLARPGDVKTVFRVPNRYLPDPHAEQVAARLRQGSTFAEALDGFGVDQDWRRDSLDRSAVLFDGLAATATAREFISLIRGEGGLDRHYSDQQRLSVTDQTAVDTLAAAEERAGTMTTAEFADAFDYETQLIESHLDPKVGIELKTIHGAKGLEWPHVIVIGADADEMPHRATLSSSDDPLAAVEDERRLAYVAFTRASERLTILCNERSPSQFIAEAAVESVATKQPLSQTGTIVTHNVKTTPRMPRGAESKPLF